MLIQYMNQKVWKQADLLFKHTFVQRKSKKKKNYNNSWFGRVSL